jgi:hypothetical protein
MEQVFADVFYDFAENQGGGLSVDAYIDLVELYLRVLRETTNWLCTDNRRGGPVGRLLAECADASDELTILTFNHDLVIENEIFRRARLRARWCLDHGYGSLADEMTVLSPGRGAAVFSLHRDALCGHTRPIRLLKLHGSLNWAVRLNSARPTANFLAGGANRQLHLLNRRQMGGREVYRHVTGRRGRTQWRLWPVVVPPVYAKQALRGAIQPVWNDARHALENAERLVVFGYSLPHIDVEAEKLLERALARNSTITGIDLINPANAAAQRFAGLGGTRALRWFPSTEAFMDGGGLIRG